MNKLLSKITLSTFLLIALVLQSAYARAETSQATSSNRVFEYDQTLLAKATPWTSQEFQNDPKEFQFVIIGDRTGGANA